MSVPTEMSKYLGSARKISDIWGTLIYNVKAYGAKGDGVTDDTSAFQSALNDIISMGGGVLVIPKPTSFYNVTKSITGNFPDGTELSIVGLGYPEIRLTKNGLAGTNTSIFNLQGISANPANVIVSIRGLQINGVGVPQQWTQTDVTKLTQVRGIDLKVTYGLVEDCYFSNIYGYGIRYTYYEKAIVSNCHFNQVGGHWYTNDGNDAFGDGVYFGYSQDNNALAVCEKSRIVGYPSNLSRIGVTIEYAAGNVHVDKCYFEGYDRTVHCENAPGAQITISNSDIERYNVGFFLHTGAKSVDIVNVNFRNNNNGNYSGTSGPIGTYTMNNYPDYIRITNCNFNLMYAVESFVESLTSFEGCNFTSVNVGAIWTIKTGTKEITDFINCRFYGRVIYFYGSKVGRFVGCSLEGYTGSTEVLRFEGTNSYARKFADCRLLNGMIAIANQSDFNFEFDSCRFEKDGTISIIDHNGNAANGFIWNYNTTIIARDCIEIVNAAFPIDYYGGSAIRLLGTNNKVVAGTWGAYP